jgi:hypothetical protein
VFSDDPSVFENFENRLDELRLTCTHNVKFDYVYRYRFEMKMEDAILLHKLYRKRFDYSYNELFFLFLTVSMIISMNINNFPLFYIPKEMRKRKTAFFYKIRSQFDKEQHEDELRTYLTIVLNAFVYGTSFIKKHHLNNKFVKDVRKRFLKYWNDSVTCMRISNLGDFLRSQVNVIGREDGRGEPILSKLYDEEFFKVQQFLYYNSRFEINGFPRFAEYEHPNAIHDAVPFLHVVPFSSDRFIIKIQKISMQRDIHDEHVENKLVLWTTIKIPSVAQMHSLDIRKAAEVSEQKRMWKTEFLGCIEEIADEVAYRPGKCKMLEATEDFYERIRNLSSQ